MLSYLPTAAVQTFAGLVREDEGEAKPFQLDCCHALLTTTDTVREYYPKWYREPALRGAVLKIHEYQGKEIFRRFSMRPRGIPGVHRRRGGEGRAGAWRQGLGGQGADSCRGPGQGWRGEGGEIAGRGQAARNGDSRHAAGPHQTGTGGQKVRRLLVEEGADIKKELYVGMVVDRGTQRVALMASAEGRVDIEAVAANTPEKSIRCSSIRARG
jgi:hypothetical protein